MCGAAAGGLLRQQFTAAADNGGKDQLQGVRRPEHTDVARHIRLVVTVSPGGRSKVPQGRHGHAAPAG